MIHIRAGGPTRRLSFFHQFKLEIADKISYILYNRKGRIIYLRNDPQIMMPYYNARRKTFNSALIALLLLSVLVLTGIAESPADECDDCCHGDCLSGCGCVSCPPSLLMVTPSFNLFSIGPAIHSWTASETRSTFTQEWFGSVFHPPQNNA